MPVMEFLERIAGGVNGCKKTKLRIAYLLCLERAVSSIDFKHKQWPSVSVRVAALYRRACKWSKTEGLEAAAPPVSALLLLRASLPPEELLLYMYGIPIFVLLICLYYRQCKAHQGATQ